MSNFRLRWLVCLALVAGLPGWLGQGRAGEVSATSLPPWDTFSDTWVATDGLGRSLPTSAETGPVRPGKTVGIFYFL